MTKEADAAWRSMSEAIELQMADITAEAEKASARHGKGAVSLQTMSIALNSTVKTCFRMMRMMSDRIAALEEQATRP